MEIIAGSVLCAALMSVAFALRDITFTNRICQQSFAIMGEAQRNHECRDWTFRPVCGISRYNVLYKTDMMREDREHFLNKHYARQYGQKSIKLTPVPAV